MRGRGLIRLAFAAAFFGLAGPTLANTPPATAQAQAESLLAAAPKGARFGLLVVDDAGSVIASVNPDQRFIPASNTKMFTTAAAYALLPGMDEPDKFGGTEVIFEFNRSPRIQDVRLIGKGDARMSSAADCKSDCLATLVDAVAGNTRRVRDVIGDDSFWPDQRWSPGMSWNNIGTDDGTAASALNLDDNQIAIGIYPGAPGQAPTVTMPPYFTLHNEAITGPVGSPKSLAFERGVNGTELRLYGSIPAGSASLTEHVGIDDPAHYAAWTFRRMLEARGVKVTGKVRVLHRAPQLDDQVFDYGKLGTPIVINYRPLARLTPPALAEDVGIINKVSQNLHAQILFHRLGDIWGTGSNDWSVKAEQDLFTKAGIPREGYDFSDGSGMSTYNRVSPRAAVALLRWIDTQPWGKAWYASLPIAGVDGTLKRRFIGTPLANNLVAKTGTLNATNALSGTFRAASGRRLTFAFFANDVPDGQTALPVMEAVLLGIAASN